MSVFAKVFIAVLLALLRIQAIEPCRKRFFSLRILEQIFESSNVLTHTSHCKALDHFYFLCLQRYYPTFDRLSVDINM